MPGSCPIEAQSFHRVQQKHPLAGFGEPVSTWIAEHDKQRALCLHVTLPPSAPFDCNFLWPRTQAPDASPPHQPQGAAGMGGHTHVALALGQAKAI